MFDAYTNDEDCFSGAATDNFDQKFQLFIRHWDQADIPEEERHRAFSVMLFSTAHQFFDVLSRKT